LARDFGALAPPRGMPRMSFASAIVRRGARATESGVAEREFTRTSPRRRFAAHADAPTRARARTSVTMSETATVTYLEKFVDSACARARRERGEG
jgi:hypothetical protein